MVSPRSVRMIPALPLASDVMEQPYVTCIYDIPGQSGHMSTAVESAQGEKVCPAGSVGASIVGLLGVGKGVLVGVSDWMVIAGWDGGQCLNCNY
jgi:hypothetical protein